MSNATLSWTSPFVKQMASDHPHAPSASGFHAAESRTCPMGGASLGTAHPLTAAADDGLIAWSHRSTLTDSRDLTDFVRPLVGTIAPEADLYIVLQAHRLCRMWPFRRCDVDDLTQELRLAWVSNHHRYDPAWGSIRPFLKTIIQRSASKLRSKARARSRRSVAISTEALLTPSGSRRLNALPRSQKLGTTPGTVLTPEQHVDLRADLQQLVQKLPSPLAQLCERLMYHTAAEISREEGIPESTIASRISSIRRRFERHQLSDFL